MSVMWGKKVAVPMVKTYVVFEYIQSTGTQYIDTGYKPKYNSRVIADISDLPTGNAMIFGVRNANSATASKQFNAYRNGTTAIRSDYFGTNKTANISDTTTRTIIDKNANVMTAWGLTITNTAVSSGICETSLFLFAINNSGTVNSLSKYKLYACQIYDNGTLVRDYVPVQIIKSGEIGLWDKVENKFYPNAGTGEFLTGKIVA